MCKTSYNAGMRHAEEKVKLHLAQADACLDEVKILSGKIQTLVTEISSHIEAAQWLLLDAAKEADDEDKAPLYWESRL